MEDMKCTMYPLAGRLAMIPETEKTMHFKNTRRKEIQKYQLLKK
jgi:hypothetical protein